MKIIFSYFYQIINLNKKNPLLANTCLVHGWNQGGKCREISAIYRVSEASDTTFRGDKSEGQFFAKNGQKIDDISAISDKSAILRKNRLGRQLIADLSMIYHRFFRHFLLKISPLSSVIWRPRSRPCWSDDHNWISTVIKRSNNQNLISMVT